MKEEPKYSIIIPVYNRPLEINELLQSLTQQTYTDFEVIIVEDGSIESSEDIVIQFIKKLTIKYYFKANGGPGLARNYGAEHASGAYLIFFDSDCIIPNNYLDTLNSHLDKTPVDAFGGPDMAHPSFTNIQKAISYSMTSFFTTGGIRGSKETMDKFYPRSFNMGITKAVYQKTGGFSTMRFGEDIDFSLRILDNGFKTKLFRDAKVYHKRRGDFKKFFKQVFNSGVARINLFKRHPKSLKIVHTFPSIFTLGILFLIGISFISFYFLLPILVYIFIIFFDSLFKNKSIKVSLLSIIASFTQLVGYGAGFLTGFWNRIILRKQELHFFKKNFYK
jgi:glycosyltransferase involved in cell wall biosynthesis